MPASSLQKRSRVSKGLSSITSVLLSGPPEASGCLQRARCCRARPTQPLGGFLKQWLHSRTTQGHVPPPPAKAGTPLLCAAVFVGQRPCCDGGRSTPQAAFFKAGPSLRLYSVAPQAEAQGALFHFLLPRDVCVSLW